MKKLFFNSLGMMLLVLFLINVANLLVEIAMVKDFETWSLSFKHGYFILNGDQVGFNIFGNIAALAILIFAVMMYRSGTEKRLSAQ